MTESQIQPIETGPSGLVPGRHTLDGFVLQPGCVEGVALQSLEAGTALEVHTRHSLYRVVVLDPAQQIVLVTGGSLFPEATEVCLEGATAGGSALKIGWIGVGLKLEISMGLRRITPSRVRSVTIENVPPRRPAPLTI